MKNSSGDSIEQAEEGESASPGSAATTRKEGTGWLLVAVAVFGLGLVTPFHEVWREDISVVVPMFPRFEGELAKGRFFWKWIGETEQRFVAWQVARNARILREAPGSLFDTEQCYPSQNMMALGEPMIALGVLGIPFQFLLGDPLETYNWVLVSVILLSAISMFLLVKEWTGVPAAGVVAGLLYAFHPDKIADINHYYIHDNLWTVLALLAARRFFVRGYWRDAIGLAACCGMQIAGSYYPFVGAILIAPPLLLWLCKRYGISNLRAGPVALLIVLVAAVGYGVFAPYLEMRMNEVLITRHNLHFAVLSEFLPGAGRFPGWMALGLVGVAAAGVRRDTLWIRPTAPLVAACVLVGLMTISGSTAENAPTLYGLLAGLVPGLDAVRRPNEILSAWHLCFTLLAGIGCARLLRRVSRAAALPVAIGLIVVAYVTTLRPQMLGLDSPVVYRAMSIRPAAVELAFFEQLQQRGNTGPILETPAGAFHVEAHRLFLSGYHRRQTSSCVNELNPNAAQVHELIRALPAREAITGIRALGFTTIVSHHPSHDQEASGAAEALAVVAEHEPALLRRILRSPSMTAYQIGLSREPNP